LAVATTPHVAMSIKQVTRRAKSIRRITFKLTRVKRRPRTSRKEVIVGERDLYPPPGTDESISERGEERAKKHHEPGRIDLGKDDQGRPAGGSSSRMKTGIDPQDPADPNSPSIPPG
jgi:hypothetical protein